MSSRRAVSGRRPWTEGSARGRAARLAGLLALLPLSACSVAGNAVDAVDRLLTDTVAVRAPGQTQDAELGVGIVGTVTAATPSGLRVNGLEVDTTPATLLRLGTDPASPLEAAMVPEGHVVEVAAERSAGRLIAREIEPIFALAGPLQAVDRDNRRLRVMGTDVLLEPDAVLPAGGLAAFRPGQRVAVSGLWRGERVVASRIDFRTRKTTQPAMVSGVVTPMPGARYRIGGVPLAAELGDLRPGFFHVVSGRWVTGTLLVEEIRFGRSVVGRWPVEVLTVEGYGRARDFAGFYSGYPGPDRGGYFEGYAFTGEEGVLGDDPAWRDHWADLEGLGRPVNDRDAIGPFTETRAIFVGDYEGGFDGAFDVDYVIPVPEGLGARRDTLSAVGDGLAPVAGAVDVR